MPARGHVTIDVLQRWKRGQLAAADVVAVAQHLEACAECAELAAQMVRADASANALHVQLEDDPHPAIDELFAFVDGVLVFARRVAVGEHVQRCGVCAEDVADAVRARDSAVHHAAPAARRTWWLVAAAVLAIAIAAAAFVLLREKKIERVPVPVTKTMPEPPPAPAPTPTPVSLPPQPRYQRVEWAAVVREARNGAVLAMPATLAAVRRDADRLRAPGHQTAAVLAPAGVSIETQRPAFTWPATRGASYVVTIFAGDREVARSSRLTKAQWTPPRELARGTTYTWQVEVEREGELRIVPEPPAPPAQFHVAGAATVAELEAARQAHPDDHLLLGLLAARAGLVDRARAELQRAEASGERDVAARVLGEVESWNRR
ncbi:MAG TPA: hypothetical protein VF698_14215 [Thermoanaerobaculia bacterium]|jgi:anti-sigma factor ChrR (cupin superfamily)